MDVGDGALVSLNRRYAAAGIAGAGPDNAFDFRGLSDEDEGSADAPAFAAPAPPPTSSAGGPSQARTPPSAGRPSLAAVSRAAQIAARLYMRPCLPPRGVVRPSGERGRTFRDPEALEEELREGRVAARALANHQTLLKTRIRRLEADVVRRDRRLEEVLQDRVGAAPPGDPRAKAYGRMLAEHSALVTLRARNTALERELEERDQELLELRNSVRHRRVAELERSLAQALAAKGALEGALANHREQELSGAGADRARAALAEENAQMRRKLRELRRNGAGPTGGSGGGGRGSGEKPAGVGVGDPVGVRATVQKLTELKQELRIRAQAARRERENSERLRAALLAARDHAVAAAAPSSAAAEGATGVGDEKEARALAEDLVRLRARLSALRRDEAEKEGALAALWSSAEDGRLREREAAAVQIQAVFRGHLARSRAAALRDNAEGSNTEGDAAADDDSDDAEEEDATGVPHHPYESVAAAPHDGDGALRGDIRELAPWKTTDADEGGGGGSGGRGGDSPRRSRPSPQQKSTPERPVTPVRMQRGWAES